MRLSSDRPALQNIPVGTTGGRRLREFFLPQLSLPDYSVIERRIAEHLSKDDATWSTLWPK